jgi:energy-coupling factor transporter ATP-binding protein EcfA2
MEGYDVVLGEYENWNRWLKTGLLRADRRRHCYVLGQTGTGKSTLLHSMIVQDIHRGEGVVVIDPHGSLADAVLASIPKERVGDVIFVDPSETSRPVGINPLYGAASLSQEERERKATRIHSAIKGVYEESWGAELERVLMASLLALMDAPTLRPTLLSALQIIDDKGYREKVKKHIKNPAAYLYFHKTLASYRKTELAQKTSSTSNKLFQIVASTHLVNIFGQYRPSFDFRQIMDEQKILIVRIPQSKIGEIYCSLFGAMIVSELYQSAIERGQTTAPGDDPNQVEEYEISDCYLYIDEFHKIRSASLDATFSEARKYRLNLTIAHQYLDQLNRNTLNAVLGNAGTTIAFRPSPEDAEILAGHSKDFKDHVYTSLHNGEVIATRLEGGEPRPGVRAKTYMLPRYSNRRIELIKNVSAYKHGRTREKVEKAINRELGITQYQEAVEAEKKRYARINKQKKSIQEMVKNTAKKWRMPKS